MKIVLYCTKLQLNEAIDNTKAEVDTKSMEGVLKCTKSKLNQAISELLTKAINLTISILVLRLYRVLSLVIHNSPNNGLINTIPYKKVFFEGYDNAFKPLNHVDWTIIGRDLVVLSIGWGRLGGILWIVYIAKPVFVQST